MTRQKQLKQNRTRTNGRPQKRSKALPGPIAQKCLAVKHFVRLALPKPAEVMRRIATNYTFLYRASGAAIAGVPPVVLSSYYQVSQFADAFKSDWPVLAQLLDKHVLIGCLLAGLWVFFVMWLRRVLLSFAEDAPPGWDMAPITVLKAIDNVVGEKQQRFANCVKSFEANSSPPAAADVFSTITQPSNQMAELVKAIYTTFDVLLRGTLESNRHTLKVNLALIDSVGKIRSIPYHYPSNRPVRSTIDALNKPSSTIRSSVSRKKMIVLESVLAETAKSSPRFTVTDNAYAQEDGALLCYPVVLEGIDSVVLVISVFVDVPNAFRPKHVEAYRQVIEPFALRLKLEYALLILKDGSSV